MNHLYYRVTPRARDFDAVAAEAARRGIAGARAELVGLVPRAAFDGRFPGSVGLPDLTPAHYLDTHLDGLP
jgi:hypothetical protein